MTTDALNDWCEENFVWTDLIAEFWNTVSNIIYIIIGLWTIFEFKDNKLYSRLTICGVSLCFIGIGSMSYHGTITRWGQAFDELAILYWEVTLLACVFQQNEINYSWIKYCYIPFVIFETILYWQMDKYPTIGWALYHPLHVIVDIIVVYTLYSKYMMLTNGNTTSFGIGVLIRGLKLIFFAFFCWLLDFFMCHTFYYLYLHAFGWHIFSGLAIFHLHVALAALIAMENKKNRLDLKIINWKIIL